MGYCLLRQIAAIGNFTMQPEPHWKIGRPWETVSTPHKRVLSIGVVCRFFKQRYYYYYGLLAECRNSLILGFSSLNVEFPSEWTIEDKGLADAITLL
jgi:hypothetical protein